MLNFFRMIRKSLIDEGNLKKYLIYAIGEILLVLVGILLALQVDSWNNLRKNRALEISTLLEIKTALIQDTITITKGIHDLGKSLVEMNKSRSQMELKKLYEDFLDRSLMASGQQRQWGSHVVQRSIKKNKVY